QGAQRGLAARTRPVDQNFKRLHAVLLRLAAGVFGRDLRSVRRRLARALEAHRAGGRPGDRVPLRVGDGDDRVVEGGVHVSDARRDVLALATANAGLTSFCSFTSHGSAVLLLLAGDRLGGALAGAGVGVGALAADRQAPAVAQAAVAAKVHQAL